MKSIRLAWLVIGMLAMGGAQASADTDFAIGKKIEFGAVDAQGTSVDWGHAATVVDEPMDQVLGVVRDYANYDRFLPNFKKSRVIAERGDRAMVYLEVGILKDTVTLWGQFKLTQTTLEDGHILVEAKLVKGNIEEFSARWELWPTADGSRTNVDFRILVDPDLPLPSSLFSKENVKAAKRTMRALHKRVAETVQG